MYTFVKQPAEVLDYDIDMSAWFSSIPGDDINSVEVSVSSPTETTPELILGPGVLPDVVLMGNEPVRFKVWVGGGTNLAEYIVTCLVTTEQDRKKEVEFKVRVRNT